MMKGEHSKQASLSSITLPKGVTSIGNDAFYACTNLTSIIIPAGVTSIAASTFSNCTSLTSVILPAGLTSIGEDAFVLCTNLTSITIPVKTVINSNAFGGWTDKQAVIVLGQANRAATITAGWHATWDSSCNAKIIYLGSLIGL